MVHFQLVGKNVFLYWWEKCPAEISIFFVRDLFSILSVFTKHCKITEGGRYIVHPTNVKDFGLKLQYVAGF